MILKTIVDEDFVNYKEPSMLIAFPNCSFKCDKESGSRVCQNGALFNCPDISVNAEYLCKRYIENNLTKAIICGGLEPLDSMDDIIEFLTKLRIKYQCMDNVVIYTGYTESECVNMGIIDKLSAYKNIIIKFGRFIPNNKPHYDKVLGISLASPNQHAEKIS